MPALGASVLLAGAAPVGASRAVADPSFGSAVASIRAVSTAGVAEETGDVPLPPRFGEAVGSSSALGGSSDVVTVDQASTLRGGAANFAGVISESSLDASAADGGTAMDPLGESRLTVVFATDEPTTLLLEGLLTARVSGAPPSCSEAFLSVMPGDHRFEAAEGPGCGGESRVPVDEALLLQPGSHTIRLELSAHAFADQAAGAPQAQASASWSFDITLCSNVVDDGPDEIEGTDGADVLCGGGGDDIILGGEGADTIKGGGGNDTLRGGSESDDLWGGDGDDIVDGGTGNFVDRLSGGAGADRILGGAGGDRIYGASLFHAAGDLADRIDGGAGDDRIFSEGGGDVIEGGGGNDLILGGGGADTMRGGPGADTVRAEGGNDDLIGSGGEDLLDGGAGNDVANACDGRRDVVVGGQGGWDRARTDRVDLVSGSTERNERCGSSRRRS